MRTSRLSKRGIGRGRLRLHKAAEYVYGCATLASYEQGSSEAICEQSCCSVGPELLFPYNG